MGVFSTFNKWMTTSLTIKQSIILCIVAAIMVTLGQTAISITLDAIHYQLSPNPAVTMTQEQDNTTNTNDTSLNVFSPVLLLYLLVGAISEEFKYRFIPLIVVYGILKVITPKLSLALQMLIILISSFIFGVAHGGYDHLLVQGLGGIVLCIIFLKCGGNGTGSVDVIREDRSVLKGWIFSSGTHLTMNYMAIVINFVFYGIHYVTFH
jgi:membrane protease YdiL (CAAX protease family)